MIDTGFDTASLYRDDQFVPARLDGAPLFRSHRSDAIGCYLRDIGRYPLLSKEQEQKLAHRIRRSRLQFRRAMLQEPAVLAKLAELLMEVGRGSLRAERVMDVGVTQFEEKKRLVRVAAINGRTLSGMVAHLNLSQSSARCQARLDRAIRLVEETKLKTREIETSWRSLPDRDSAPQRHLRKYEKRRNKMVAANLRLAVAVARKYRGRGLPFLDLVQEATTGLFRAVDKFDPDRGLKFSTYAVWWAKQTVRAALSEKSRLMRLNPTAMQRVRALQQRAEKLQQDTERKIGLDDVAKSIGLPRDELQHYWNARKSVTSLDRPMDTHSGETYSDCLPDNRVCDGFRRLVDSDNRNTIRKALRCLEPRERQVIRLRFGLSDGEFRNLAEVGRKMSLTRERIRQIEKVSLEKLRNNLGRMQPEAIR